MKTKTVPFLCRANSSGQVGTETAFLDSSDRYPKFLSRFDLDLRARFLRTSCKALYFVLLVSPGLSLRRRLQPCLRPILPTVLLTMVVERAEHCQVAARRSLPDPESCDVSTLRRERDELLARLKEMMPQVRGSTPIGRPLTIIFFHGQTCGICLLAGLCYVCTTPFGTGFQG